MPRARSTHVERLADGASLLGDAKKVVESVVLALSEAVPRAHFFCGVSRDHPALEFGVSAACRQGQLLDPSALDGVFAGSPSLWNRWSVEADQRDRWVSYFGVPGEALGEFWRRRWGVQLSQFRRIVLCEGARPLAYVAANLIEGRWSPAELAAVSTRFRAISGALRLAAMAFRARYAPENLSTRLLERSPGALVLSPSGALIAASPVARDWLRRDEELGQWLSDKPPQAGAFRLRRLSLQVAPYASRTGLRWQIVHCTPSQELPPTRLTERASTPLSPREREICEWLIAGYTNAEIAAQVGVRPSTVKTMLERLYSKLDVGGRVDLTRLLSREA